MKKQNCGTCKHKNLYGEEYPCNDCIKMSEYNQLEYTKYKEDRRKK